MIETPKHNAIYTSPVTGQTLDSGSGRGGSDERNMLELTPITISEAKAFVSQYHRHHKAPQGALFAIGCTDGEKVVGVAIVGRPVARMADNGWTAEVVRLCTDDTPHVASKLYSACWRAARAMGWKKLITYVLKEETGTSLKAAGWKCIGECGGGSWSRKERPRVDKHPMQSKIKWETEATR